MTEYDKIIIASLECYLNNKDCCMSFETDTARQLIKRSREQKILPVIFLKNSSEFKRVLPDGEFAKLKTEVTLGVTSQLQRNAELVRVCRILEADGMNYAVVKGAVCRTLYADSEYRTSSDEDILVGKDNLENAKKLLLNSGYIVADEKNGEVKLINPILKSIIELHSSLVDNELSGEMKQIGDLFITQIANPFSLNTEAGSINTFYPTYSFLALCVHFYSHFVRGGIGIRPVMDIACFIKAYSDEIDFDYCFSVLRTISAEKMIKTVISLCVRYFNTEFESYENKKSVDRLLYDILGAGAYGTSDSGRVHSGTVTKEMVGGDKGTLKTALSVIFPPEKEIISVYPELKGKNKEIRKYRIKRIMGFAGESGKIKTITTAGKRRKLLKELGIGKAAHNREE